MQLTLPHRYDALSEYSSSSSIPHTEEHVEGAKQKLNQQEEEHLHTDRQQLQAHHLFLIVREVDGRNYCVVDEVEDYAGRYDEQSLRSSSVGLPPFSDDAHQFPEANTEYYYCDGYSHNKELVLELDLSGD